MPTYGVATKETCQQVAAVMKQYHGSKAEAGVTVRVLMAYPNTDENGDPVGHAITVGGYRAVASIKILPVKARVAYGFDAEMVIDAGYYEESTETQQEALIDHELLHLELAVDDEGNVKRDDAERPKMRIRKHDRALGAFDLIAKRHGENAPEVRLVREWLDDGEYTQLYLFETAEA